MTSARRATTWAGGPRVVVTGMGAISALGQGVGPTWDGLVAGRSGIRTIASFDPSRVDSKMAGEVRDFERRELEKIGMPEEIALRHRPTQFGHIFSGDHYASGYYSYMWSEVMDADAFGAFEEAGDIFAPAVAKRLRDDIYASGGSRDPEEAYIAFRGRAPEPDALLRRRGLLDTPEAA